MLYGVKSPVGIQMDSDNIGGMAGRTRNPNESKKVHPVLSEQFRGYLDQLVDIGYGKTPTDAARYLIERGIDDLIRAGTIRAAPNGRSPRAQPAQSPDEA